MNLVDHKKARFNYEIQETYEAGMELLGGEVKSLRAGRGSLEGSYVIIRGGEAYVVGMQIPPYQPINMGDEYDPMRTRRILLTRDELRELSGIESKKGSALVPLAVFAKGRKLKLSFGVGRGKKKFDKRETIKKRDVERSIRREHA